MTTDNLLFLDTETTGLDPAIHEPIEVGAVLCSPDGDIVMEYSVRMQPSPGAIERAEPKALEVNGYTPELWADALPRAVVAKTLHSMSTDARLVASNVAFDAAMSTRLLKEHGFKPAWSHRLIDIGAMAWPLNVLGYLERTGLFAMCEELGIPPEPEVHRAINGARLHRLVYLALLERYRTLISP